MKIRTARDAGAEDRQRRGRQAEQAVWQATDPSLLTHKTIYVDDASKRATEAGIALPPAADLHGTALADALVKAGTAPDGTFWGRFT